MRAAQFLKRHSTRIPQVHGSRSLPAADEGGPALMNETGRTVAACDANPLARGDSLVPALAFEASQASGKLPRTLRLCASYACFLRRLATD